MEVCPGGRGEVAGVVRVESDVGARYAHVVGDARGAHQVAVEVADLVRPGEVGVVAPAAPQSRGEDVHRDGVVRGVLGLGVRRVVDHGHRLPGGDGDVDLRRDPPRAHPLSVAGGGLGHVERDAVRAGHRRVVADRDGVAARIERDLRPRLADRHAVDEDGHGFQAAEDGGVHEHVALVVDRGGVIAAGGAGDGLGVVVGAAIAGGQGQEAREQKTHGVPLEGSNVARALLGHFALII